MSNLQEIAESVKRQHEAQPEIEETTQEEELAEFEEEGVVVEGYDDEENYSDDDDDDEPVIAVGVATANGPVIVKNDSITGVNNDGVQVDEDDEFVLTDEELKATMPDLDDEAFINSSEKIRNELNTYRKNLILNSGFTVEEATKAAYNRAKKLGQEENDAYLVDHPTLGIVEIDKKNVDKVDFTEDEREKLTKVRAIKLKVTTRDGDSLSFQAFCAVVNRCGIAPACLYVKVAAADCQSRIGLYAVVVSVDFEIAAAN